MLKLPLVLSGIAVALTGLYQPAFTNAQTTTKPFYVGTCKPGKADFTTIQEAVTTVPPGSTINICPGSYPEQITIQQPLTLQGVQSGNNAKVVITSPSAPTVSFNSTSFQGPVAAQLVVSNTSGPVNISQLAVDGTGFAVGLANLAGIAFQSSSGTLNQVSQLLTPPSNGFWGIVIVNDGGIAQTVSMKNSLVQGGQNEGIYIDGQAITFDVENNYLFLSGAQDGIFVGDGSTGTISGNTVDLQNGGGDGMRLFESSAATISGNAIANSGTGIFTLSPSTTNITKNSVSASLGGILFESDPGSTIQGNQIMPSTSGYGIALVCGRSAPGISGNLFLGGAVGVANVPSGVPLQKKAGTFVNVPTIEQLCP